MLKCLHNVIKIKGKEVVFIMKVKIKDNKPKLTVVERKILNELKKYDYKILQKEIASILGISSSSVCKHEKNLEEKGYNIK